MTEKYVVEVAAPGEGEAEAAAQQLAGILNLDLHRVTSLINRLPDVVTKPISHREATVVVERFSQAGLNARFLPVTAASSAPEAVAAPPAPLETPEEGTVFEDDSAFTEQPDQVTTDFVSAAAQSAVPLPDSPPAVAADEFHDISPADLQARLK